MTPTTQLHYAVHYPHPNNSSTGTLSYITTPTSLHPTMENREVDMEEWEFIPNQTSYLDLALHSPKKELHFNPQTDYFVCPSEESSTQEKDVDEPEFKENISVVTELKDKDEDEPEFKENISVVPELKEKYRDEDEPEFKDIGVVPDVESSKSIVEMNTRFDEKDVKDEEFEHIEKEVDFKEAETKRKVRCGFGGVGALCSIGVAAATICIFVLGGRQQQQKQQFQNQRIQFQIYGNDKRMKQVAQQAGRLNQALSVAVRGVPATTAHISFGGYYDGL